VSVRGELEEKFRGIMREELHLGSLVSYVGNKEVPFLRIYRFKEAFAFDLVREFFRRFGVCRDDYVFDPFSGLGTTLFVSALCGVPSIGIDMLPLAHFVSKTLPLFLLLRENEVRSVWESVKRNMENAEPAEVADVPIVRRAFDRETLLTLRKMKSAICELPPPHRDVFLLLFFSILEECSFTSKDGQFLRIRADKKVSNPVEAMKRKVAQVEEDVRRIRILFPDLHVSGEVLPDVYLADARDLSSVRFRRKPTVVVTSPPYINRYDYTRSYALELCFHFVRSSEELKKLRRELLRSHIESKLREGERPPHPAVEEVIRALSEKELNNPRIPDMIVAYFADMQKVISELGRVLERGARVAVVVGNVRFEGEVIPVDLILSDMAEGAGFEVEEIIVARYKGNSSQQMKKYGRVPVRESVLVWIR